MIVEAVITTGRSLPWKARDDRELRIDVAGIKARIDTGIPVLHRHNWEASTLGYLDDAWIEDGSLKGALVLTGRQGRAVSKGNARRVHRSLLRHRGSGIDRRARLALLFHSHVHGATFPANRSID